jgi:outer membrane protein W
MRFAIFAGLVAVSLAASSTALADPTASGIEVGLRAGYSLPLGNLDGGAGNGAPADKLSDTISGRIPIWIDAGYRINPNMYVGAFFQYGIVSLASNAFGSCGTTGISCSAHDIELGAMFAYHLMPDQTIDPWAGIGIGYESLSGSASVNGSSVGGASFSGFQFANIQIGADYKVMPNLGIGPFASFALGSYGSESTTDQNGNSTSVQNFNSSLHEWLTFGVRGVYDINLQ